MKKFVMLFVLIIIFAVKSFAQDIDVYKRDLNVVCAPKRGGSERSHA